MINHGLSTGGLFLLVGMIYERYHTRQLDDLGGLAARLPLLALRAGVHFAVEHRPAGAERLRRRNAVAGRHVRAAPAVRGAGSDRAWCSGRGICSRCCSTLLFGPLRGAASRRRSRVGDMNLREALALAPICVLCLWIGVRPQPLVDVIRPDVEAVAALYADGDAQTAALAATPKVPSWQASRYEHGNRTTERLNN